MTNKQTKLIDMVLRQEGGYSAPVKGDSGGETYRGIARNYNRNWEGWQRVDAAKPIKYNAIISDPVLETMVRNYYLQHFYKPMKIDEITDPQIAAHLYCHGVNAGISAAVKMLQKAINIAVGTNIAVDGMIGSITLGHCNGANHGRIANQFVALREAFYRRIATGAKAKFLRGWLNRVATTTAVSKTI